MSPFEKHSKMRLYPSNPDVLIDYGTKSFRIVFELPFRNVRDKIRRKKPSELRTIDVTPTRRRGFDEII
jgi:hypothetical protein